MSPSNHDSSPPTTGREKVTFASASFTDAMERLAELDRRLEAEDYTISPTLVGSTVYQKKLELKAAHLTQLKSALARISETLWEVKKGATKLSREETLELLAQEAGLMEQLRAARKTLAQFDIDSATDQSSASESSIENRA